jgi:hypothetical protein
VTIDSNWVALTGFAGSIRVVEADRLQIAGPGLALLIEISSASDFSWGDEREQDFDPETFESELRFKSKGMVFTLSVSK